MAGPYVGRNVGFTEGTKLGLLVTGTFEGDRVVIVGVRDGDRLGVLEGPAVGKNVGKEGLLEGL